jgi:hypothetical protein
MSGSRGAENEDVFWDITPCSVTGIDRRFRRVYCLHHHGATSENISVFNCNKRLTPSNYIHNITTTKIFVSLVTSTGDIAHTVTTPQKKKLYRMTYIFKIETQDNDRCTM